MAAGQRIGVVQGTVQEAYVIDTLHLQPVKFPDYSTVYASLKTRQVDAWVTPSQQAHGTVQPCDPAQIIENTFSFDRRAELRAGCDHRGRHMDAAVLRLGAARPAARMEALIEGGACTPTSSAGYPKW
jgi:hypothetical protein